MTNTFSLVKVFLTRRAHAPMSEEVLNAASEYVEKKLLIVVRNYFSVSVSRTTNCICSPVKVSQGEFFSSQEMRLIFLPDAGGVLQGSLK